MGTRFENSDRQLAVLDPGLREQGGHHPALILALLGTNVFNRDNSRLRVFANAEFTPSTVFQNATSAVEYSAFFKSDFYRYFYENPHHKELPNFISNLAEEYLVAMHQVVGEECQAGSVEGSSSILFFHALGWEHATALANAFFLFKKQTGITLRAVVILMFSPYRKTANSDYDSNLYLRYRIAFKRLAECQRVEFFACDHETSKAYEFILARQINTIPSPFVGAIKIQAPSSNKDKKVVLYLGDSKATKGFLALPNLLEQIVSQEQEESFSYIIQYTLTNQSEEFLAVDQKLKAFADLHANISVVEGFWSEQQLHETLASCHTLVFNYDSSIYMYQSSGVLWLAAYYKLKMFFLSDNWLTREAARLKCDYIVCESNNLIECLDILSYQHVNKQSQYANIYPQIRDEYRTKLFSGFGEWLGSILDIKEYGVHTGNNLVERKRSHSDSK